jgi:hypothetical protein
VKLKADSDERLLKQEDDLNRRRDEDLVLLQEASAVRREASRLESEKALQDERLSRERDMLKERLQAETEGKLRLEVRLLCVCVSVCVRVRVRVFQRVFGERGTVVGWVYMWVCPGDAATRLDMTPLLSSAMPRC